MEPHVYSNKYPPKNRTDTGLHVLQIEVRDRLGVWTMDPNRAAMVGYKQELALAEPVGTSVLSGEPGYGYRTCDVDLVLTRDELFRLLRRALTPAEVQKLLETYGAFHEVHDDFYDEDEFVALQPMES